MPPVHLTLNGRPTAVSELPTTTTLLRFLRERQGLTGTKEGCAEGDCGACTVAVRDGDRYRAVCACILPVASLHGREVWTVEGIGRERAPHPAQEAMAAALGSQCGYCTPGIVMSLFEATYREELADGAGGWRLDDQLCGNLCRCTGYRPIREAAAAVAGTAPSDRFRACLAQPEAPAAVRYEADGEGFVVATTVEEAVAALASTPGARVVAGATDLGLDITQRHRRYPLLVAVDRVAAMRGVRATADGVWIGAATPLTDVEAWADAHHVPLARMLRFFGSRQIKHRATLGGNVANASPIGDTPPVLLAVDATLHLASPGGRRDVAVADFFTGYRQTVLAPDELITGVTLPGLPEGARAASYKVSKRREMDISAVAACFVVQEVDGVVRHARLAFGGMAATPARARGAEAALIGRAFDAEAVEAAVAALASDFSPMSDHRGSAWYRQTVAANLLRGFWRETASTPVPPLPDRPTGTVAIGGGR